jgi:hypothetical protein
VNRGIVVGVAEGVARHAQGGCRLGGRSNVDLYKYPIAIVSMSPRLNREGAQPLTHVGPLVRLRNRGRSECVARETERERVILEIHSVTAVVT